ncbi:MAG: DUF4465 domain-containing protein [Burkholderiales bacterium]|jgi:hypothetical protein|nr:DUF4465 domain-containing protein [Burkholderiales bacterium]
MRAFRIPLVAATLLAITAPAFAAVSTFDDIPLPGADTFLFPAASVSLTSGGATFNHDYADFGFPGCCWSGWTVSNVVDTTTPGYENQYAAIAGGGVDGSANYAVAYFGAPRVVLQAPSIVAGAWFTNTTYAALSMRDGDGFAKKFGGASGTDPDFLSLDIEGRDAAGALTGTVTFDLADFRGSVDTIVDDWTWVDLSSLGPVAALTFSLRSSDMGPFGINTPAYFAMDNLKVVPEPGTWALMLAGLAGVGVAAARRRHDATAR